MPRKFITALALCLRPSFTLAQAKNIVPDILQLDAFLP